MTMCNVKGLKGLGKSLNNECKSMQISQCPLKWQKQMRVLLYFSNDCVIDCLACSSLLFLEAECFYERLKADIKPQCYSHNETTPIMPYCGEKEFPI